MIGLSGGIDSVVMLDLLVKSDYSCGIAHCNFNLRGDESDADEEFVKTPQVELIKISKFCGFDYTYGLVFESDQYGIKHQIGGNLRTRSNKDMNLNLDDEWISKLSNLEKNIFWIISGKLARQLGYKRINKNL